MHGFAMEIASPKIRHAPEGKQSLNNLGSSVRRITGRPNPKKMSRGYTDMLPGAERTAIVFEHMFDKMGAKDQRDNFIAEKERKLKAERAMQAAAKAAIAKRKKTEERIKKLKFSKLLTDATIAVNVALKNTVRLPKTSGKKSPPRQGTKSTKAKRLSRGKSLVGQ